MSKIAPETKEENTNPSSTRRFLTVEAEHAPERVRIEMRGDMPIGMLFPLLMKTLGWKIGNDDVDPRFRLIAQTDGGDIELKSTDTLDKLGMQNGANLKIVFVSKKKNKRISEQESLFSLQFTDGLENGFSLGYANAGTQAHRKNITQPRWDEPVSEPSLIGSSGRVYPIQSLPVLIGRRYKGERPQVDLTDEEDRENPSVTRKHAEIFFEEKNYVLKPKPTLNGTFVNGTEIRSGQRCAIREGDLVRFGDVEMIFRLP